MSKKKRARPMRPRLANDNQRPRIDIDDLDEIFARAAVILRAMGHLGAARRAEILLRPMGDE